MTMERKGQPTETEDMAEADWSELPEELLLMIADRLSSGLDLIHSRCTCGSWRSSLANKPFPRRPLIRLGPFTPHWTRFVKSESPGGAFLSRAAFFRVTLRLPGVQQGWLIRSEQFESAKTRVVPPLSRFLAHYPCESLDMSELEVSEIREAFSVKDLHTGRIFSEFKRVVVVTAAGETRVVAVDWCGKIRYRSGETWTSNVDKVNPFSDIIVHGGLIHAVDTRGVVWRVNSSPSRIPYAIRYESELVSHCSHRNFVESCGELYIVDWFCKGAPRKGRVRFNDAFVQNRTVENCDSETVRFAVYKLNKECGRWVEVKSLGDRAFVMAIDCCFSVVAREFYGCQANSIYFIDHRPRSALDGLDLRMFKLDDGSISKTKSSYDCFHMFSPSYMRNWGCWRSMNITDLKQEKE